MAKTFIKVFVLFISICCGLYYVTWELEYNLCYTYATKLQTPLFTGFLTLGSFLLAIKTGILIKLKEGLYDKPEYKKLVKQKQAINSNITLYGPLTRFGNFLIYCVLCSLITSFYQITIGFISHRAVATIGISLAAVTAILVFYAWWLIRENLNQWFEMLEDIDAEDKKNTPKH